MQRGRLLDVAVADQPAPGFLCQISGILRPGPTSAEEAQQFGLVFAHESIDVVIARWRRLCRQPFGHGFRHAGDLCRWLVSTLTVPSLRRPCPLFFLPTLKDVKSSEERSEGKEWVGPFI